MLLMVKQCRLAFRLPLFLRLWKCLAGTGVDAISGSARKFLYGPKPCRRPFCPYSVIRLIFGFRDLAFADAKFDILQKRLNVDFGKPVDMYSTFIAKTVINYLRRN